MENLFDSPIKSILGLISGGIFGFLLQKGQVAKFHYVLGTFLLKEFTAAKIIATAILTGSIGFWILFSIQEVSLKIKPLLIGGVVFGGILFALGLSIFGYCPGTSVAASAEGHRDAKVGVLGMLTGAILFVYAYPSLEGLIQWGGDFGKITLPDVTGVNNWVWIAALATVLLLAFILAEKKIKTGTASPSHFHPKRSLMDT